ncbi:MAG: hypothetical protein Q8922_09405 [Bacteroidota bacterium]|nr:hypothetical protein [Bacteroidota bacterium]MDP4234251.1 hypothetical protein [Bacteroidota bacterium]MDP4243441.1 hypothetical protein [Bacteroidota bacterium]MDP4288140.1 hypothetical protein [Bacteroidota bacterium]
MMTPKLIHLAPILFVALVLCIGCSSSPDPNQGGAGQNLTGALSTPLNIDFGSIPEGTTKDTLITFKNTTHAPLTIRSQTVSPSCFTVDGLTTIPADSARGLLFHFEPSDTIDYAGSDSISVVGQFGAKIILHGKGLPPKHYLYAGTITGAVFRSGDSGSTWLQMGVLDTAFIVLGIATLGGEVFAGTHNEGVLRSKDGGLTWKPVNSGLTDHMIYGLAAIGKILYAGTAYAGAFRSSDLGTTWTHVDGLSATFIGNFVQVGSAIFVGTGAEGLLCSQDNGETWAGTNYPAQRVRSLAVVGTTLFAASVSDVYRSPDNGASWTMIDNGLSKSSPDVGALAANGSDLYAGGSYLYHSTDNGDSWITMSNPTHFSVYMCIAPYGSQLIVGGNGGICRSSDNGATWTTLTGAISTNTVTAIGLQ